MTNQKTIDERVSALEQKVSELESKLSTDSKIKSQESNTNGKKLSVKEFVLAKKPAGDVQKNPSDFTLLGDTRKHGISQC